MLEVFVASQTNPIFAVIGKDDDSRVGVYNMVWNLLDLAHCLNAHPRKAKKKRGGGGDAAPVTVEGIFAERSRLAFAKVVSFFLPAVVCPLLRQFPFVEDAGAPSGGGNVMTTLMEARILSRNCVIAWKSLAFESHSTASANELMFFHSLVAGAG